MIGFLRPKPLNSAPKYAQCSGMTEAPRIDGRGMQPPEPLELALAELGVMASGDELVMLLNCEPLPLYDILDRGGFERHSLARADGSKEIHIRKV